jgi:hypothetical protein
MFGGAPCDDGSGCPVNEINDFEIWADEAYQMNNVRADGTYTFSACNGTGGTAWPIMFTIVAPSGAIDAFGLNNGVDLRAHLHRQRERQLQGDRIGGRCLWQFLRPKHQQWLPRNDL